MSGEPAPMPTPIPIIRLDSVDSTNDEARRRLAAGADGPFAVVAGEQTAGRGTRGRRWDSPAGAGLYLTLAMPGGRWPLASPGGRDAAACPERPPVQLVHTLAAGVAAAEALRATVGVEVRLKPVNDLIAGDGKLGGILVETILRSGRIASMVVGVGINLRGEPRRVEASAWPATSVASVLGDPDGPDAAARARLEAELVARLAAWTARTVAQGEEPIRAAWATWALRGAVAPRPA